MASSSNRIKNDTLLIGLSELECIRNVTASLELLGNLGFVAHPVQLIPTPSHKITYLGFEINFPTFPQSRKKGKDLLFSIKTSKCDDSFCIELSESHCSGIDYIVFQGESMGHYGTGLRKKTKLQP